MKRRKIKPGSGVGILATNGVVILALIGAARVICWIVNGIAHALVVRGGWAVAEAAKAAPVIFLAVAGGLVLSLWEMRKDSEHYRRSSQRQYGVIERDHARNPEYPEDKAQ
jgi:hypothetical protein